MPDGVREAESPALLTTPSDATVSEAESPAQLTASSDAPVGGQAVLEGVMMRGVAHWAVAVRKPAEGEATGPIATETFELTRGRRRRRFYRLPIVRGVVALIESMAIGMKALGIAASAQLSDEQAAEEEQAALSGWVWGVTLAIAIVFAIGLFFVVPVTLTSLVRNQLGSSWLFWLVEGVVRTAIFLGYLVLLSKLRDMRRVLEYHGAEHKVISCYEAKDELVPERAARYSRLHPRCGTSFLLVVMVVAIFVFAPIGLPAWWLLVLTRIVGVPVIAGVSFELIRWAGRNRSHGWVQAVIWPGMQLQKLTTREPDLEQLAVAIAALAAVLERETPGDLAAADLIGLEVAA